MHSTQTHINSAAAYNPIVGKGSNPAMLFNNPKTMA